MLASVVDVHRDARVVQHVAVHVREIARMREDVPGKVDDIDAPNRRMQRRGVGGVADAEADHQHVFGVVDARGAECARARACSAATGESVDDIGWPLVSSMRPLPGTSVTAITSVMPSLSVRSRSHRRARARGRSRSRTAAAARGRAPRLPTAIEPAMPSGSRRSRTAQWTSAESRRLATPDRAGPRRAAATSISTVALALDARASGRSRKPVASEPHDRAGRVREIEDAGTAADGALGALDDGVGERKGEAHEQRRNADLEQHRSRVEPQLLDGASEPGRLAARRRQDGRVSQSGAADRLRIGRANPRSVEATNSPARPSATAPAGACGDGGTRRRASPRAIPRRMTRQQQREHGAEPAEQDAEMAEPEDLHAHRRKAGQGERQRDQDRSREPGFGLRPGDLDRRGPVPPSRSRYGGSRRSLGGGFSRSRRSSARRAAASPAQPRSASTAHQPPQRR